MFASFIIICLILSLLSPNLAAAGVFINEVLPYPDDEVEAIELIYVPAESSSDSEIDLEGWTISDRLNTIYTFSSELIKEGDFLVKTFYRKLKNDGDSVIIKNKEGVIVDEFHYTNSQKGLSYSRVSHKQDIFILTTPSIGKDNQITLTPTPSNLNNNEEAEEINLQEDHQENSHQIISDLTSEEKNQETAAESVGKTQITEAGHGQPVNNREDQQLLINKIAAAEDFLISRIKKKPLFVQKNNQDSFVTTVRFQAEIISPLGLLSVIIGGLLLFISSRLIYEP